MPKTGSILLDILSVLDIFAPLLPILIILIRKEYFQETMNFLMILCLIDFLWSLVLYIIPDTPEPTAIINHVFSFLEFSILTYIFMTLLPMQARKWVSILFVCTMGSIVLTMLANGVDHKIPLLEWFIRASLILISLFSLLKLVSGDSLHIFNNPLFWIAVGSFFFFSITGLISAVVPDFGNHEQKNILGKQVLWEIAALARFFFYTMATLYFDPTKKKQKDQSLF
jgi:hypothetical protein